MSLVISLACGIAAFAVVMFGLNKALKKAQKIDQFVRQNLDMPWLADQLWWLFPALFLVVVVELVQEIVQFIDPSISFG